MIRTGRRARLARRGSTGTALSAMPGVLCRLRRAAPLLGALAGISPGSAAAGNTASGADAILEARCAACHPRDRSGTLARIGEMRKTPEGWDMTLVRMMQVHRVDIPAGERRTLVRHLADHQGLAPSEAAPWRYVLERAPGVVEPVPSRALAQMCGRCHTIARVALQRRDENEWRKLSHFHLGQYPTLEYQALSRDRDWWSIAQREVPAALGKLYPFDTPQWRAWRERAPADVSGTWRVAGHRPGQGPYHGTLRVRPLGDHDYRVGMRIVHASGTVSSGTGRATLYTGYEWRARLDIGNESVLMVGALAADGDRLSGRWFLEDADSIGARFEALRGSDRASGRILSVQPAYLRAGTGGIISIHGVGLRGEVSLGEDLTVLREISRGDESVTVEARAAPFARTGPRTVRVGDARAPDSLVVFTRVDRIVVEPAEAIARLGGAGGPLPPVPAQFDAVAYADGPDARAGSGDDVRIGVMPARWSVEPADDVARERRDARFAGRIDSHGRFDPAGAGPNEARGRLASNTGNLTVRARLTDSGRELQGTGHLVVTVQRWVDPPIR